MGFLKEIAHFFLFTTAVDFGSYKMAHAGPSDSTLLFFLELGGGAVRFLQP